jgi:hypothetical protein
MVGYTNGSVKCNIPKSGGNENIEISESIWYSVQCLLIYFVYPNQFCLYLSMTMVLWDHDPHKKLWCYNKKSLCWKFVKVGTVYRDFTVITLNYSFAHNGSVMKFLAWDAIWSCNVLSTSRLLEPHAISWGKVCQHIPSTCSSLPTS